MVGQHLAIEHPQRVRSLTSIMSTPGGRRYLPEPHALRALFMPAPRTAEEAGRAVERLFAAIGSPLWPIEGERLRAIGEAAHARGPSPRGYLRHFAAVMATPDRRPRLRQAAVPTLVIHGSARSAVPAARRARHGPDDARRDAGCRSPAWAMTCRPAVWPVIVAAIARHAERADARARV